MKRLLINALLSYSVIFGTASYGQVDAEAALKVLKEEGQAHPSQTAKGLEDCLLMGNLYRKYMNTRVADPNVLASSFLSEYPLYEDLFSQNDWNKFVRFVADNPTHQAVYSLVNGKYVFTGNLNADTKNRSIAVIRQCYLYDKMNEYIHQALPIILDVIKEKQGSPIYMD